MFPVRKFFAEQIFANICLSEQDMKGLSQQNLKKIHVFESNCNKQNDVIKKKKHVQNDRSSKVGCKTRSYVPHTFRLFQIASSCVRAVPMPAYLIQTK